KIGCVGVAMLPEVPLDASQQSRNPPALRFEEGYLEPRVELEDAAQHQRNQSELHLSRMARYVAHEAVLAEARLDGRIVGSRALVKAQRDIQLLQHAVERIPVGGVPITAVDVVGAHEGAGGAVVANAAVEFPTGKVDIMDRQHRRHLQLIRTMLTE